jgi:hypothetical protein
MMSNSNLEVFRFTKEPIKCNKSYCVGGGGSNKPHVQARN